MENNLETRMIQGFRDKYLGCLRTLNPIREAERQLNFQGSESEIMFVAKVSFVSFWDLEFRVQAFGH